MQKACRLFGGWPGVEGSTRALGESGCPTWNRTKIYGFRVRRATVALQGSTGHAGKVAWPDYPRAIGPRFIGDELFRWYQRRRWRGAESPDHFLGCIGIKSPRVGVFCIHRRKCHLAGAFAPSSWMVWQDLRMKREDAAIGWYWTPWMTSWLWLKGVRARGVTVLRIVEIRPADHLARSR